MEKKKHTTVRLSEEVRAFLLAIAKRERRTITAVIEDMIRERYHNHRGNQP